MKTNIFCYMLIGLKNVSNETVEDMKKSSSQVHIFRNSIRFRDS
jgi:hypothetical protein